MRITDLRPDDTERVTIVASLLVEAFRDEHPAAWPDLESGMATVTQSFGRDRISRVALDGDEVVGWIGGESGHDGNAWELHPLVVAPARQGEGIGRALVADLEGQVRSRGGLTVTLGADDESDQTTLGGVDLYPDPVTRLARVENLRRHPFEFYRKCGYALSGVLPDANGFGKPDILMSRRVGPAPDLPPVSVRPAEARDVEWIERTFVERWGADFVVSRGHAHRADELDALIAERGAERGAERCGLLTHRFDGDALEITTLDSLVEGCGVGSALVDAARGAAVAAACRRIWLVTTNDNLHALGFYQRRGFALVAVHRDAMAVSRRLKPSIPEVGDGGVAIRDEIELEIVLQASS